MEKAAFAPIPEVPVLEASHVPFPDPIGRDGALVAAVPADAAQYLLSFNTATRCSARQGGKRNLHDLKYGDDRSRPDSVPNLVHLGTVNGLAIVAPAGNYGNYFTTGPSFLDGTGTTFTVTGGGRVDFFNQSSNGLYRVNTFSPGSSNFVNASSSLVAAVPEPASWAMLLLGFAAIGFAMRRRPAAALRYA